ncbi:hypothetical protein ACQ33O_07390 [Ferruginibacter sp. SUN002]|uniref:hypothetical protein n=1 Tax=Ferruginibacter sp. SUN002 TaxID=2937789 RepID=UPI003D367BCB
MTVKYWFCFIGLLTLFNACKNNEQDIAILNSLNESLEASSTILESTNNILYKQFAERLYDPRTAEQSKIWQPKAISVQELSNSIFEYINQLKTELKTATTRKNIESKNVVYNILYKQKKSDELYDNLKKYKKEVLAIDPEINIHFNDNTKRKILLFDTSINNPAIFYRTFFKNSSCISAVAILSKFQNNIKHTENGMITFCYSKTSGGCILRVDKIGILVGQNTNHLKKGETFELSAGIGSYSRAAMPIININGKNIEVIDGRATYKLKASEKTGKHSVPVKIEYKDQNGETQLLTTDVEYTVDE